MRLSLAVRSPGVIPGLGECVVLLLSQAHLPGEDHQTGAVLGPDRDLIHRRDIYHIRVHPDQIHHMRASSNRLAYPGVARSHPPPGYSIPA